MPSQGRVVHMCGWNIMGLCYAHINNSRETQGVQKIAVKTLWQCIREKHCRDGIYSEGGFPNLLLFSQDPWGQVGDVDNLTYSKAPVSSF